MIKVILEYLLEGLYTGELTLFAGATSCLDCRTAGPHRRANEAGRSQEQGHSNTFVGRNRYVEMGGLEEGSGQPS